MGPSIEKLREYFLGKKIVEKLDQRNSSQGGETSIASLPSEHRSVGSHPSGELLLARIDEDPTFFESFTEQQHENGVFVQGNRFFRGSESSVREVEYPNAQSK